MNEKVHSLGPIHSALNSSDSPRVVLWPSEHGLLDACWKCTLLASLPCRSSGGATQKSAFPTGSPRSPLKFETPKFWNPTILYKFLISFPSLSCFPSSSLFLSLFLVTLAPLFPPFFLLLNAKASEQPTELFFFFNFYWSIVHLQYCSSCRCTAKWINYNIYTHIHSFLDSFLI